MDPVTLLVGLFLLSMSVVFGSIFTLGYLRWASLLGWPTDLARAVWSELWPWYMPATACIAVVYAATGPNVWKVIVLVCLLLVWWEGRNEDRDDRWRRRTRMIADRVARAGGRLRVVPTAGGA